MSVPASGQAAATPRDGGPDEAVVFGVSLNNLSGITGHRYTIRDVVRAAREAEAMGFDAVWVHDAPGGRRTVAAYDPVAVLSAIAGCTERVLLCSGILSPHLRNPVSLAASWATLHEISSGRSILGVGAGAGKAGLVRRQYQAVAALTGPDDALASRLYAKRGRFFEESVTIVRRLLHEDKVSFDGEFFRFVDVTLGDARPRSAPPIIIAGGNYFPVVQGGPVHHEWQEARAGTYQLGPYHRIRRLADGWITPHATPQEYASSKARIAGSRGEHLTDRHFTWAYNAFVNVGDDAKLSWRELQSHLESFHGPPVGDDVVDRWGIGGPAEVVAGRLQEFIDQGVRMFQLVIGSNEQHKHMRRLAEEVIPLLRT
jgi:coenzyme F420-dependent glucose-6-phosphate dehydrogenase